MSTTRNTQSISQQPENKLSDKNRSDFEVWFRAGLGDPAWLKRSGEKYADMETEHMWQSWNAARAQQAPSDPMDWPLPCDVIVGHGTIKKGVSLRALVNRTKVLYGYIHRNKNSPPVTQAESLEICEKDFIIECGKPYPE